jgi:4-hydroxy-3-methylbut-2-enyl diphosphate reductase
MNILLAKPRGFCAGVDRAIQIVERSLEIYGRPVYVRHEIVHNKAVVNRLREIGAVFVDEIDEVPEGAHVIFSAHGVAEKVYDAARFKSLHIIDAACPLVKKVHFSAKRHDANGLKVILIGHAGHPEVEGTMGQIEGEMALVSTPEDVATLPYTPEDDLAYITQTTLSIDETKDVIVALKARYPEIRGPEQGDLCYATTNRQTAVRELAAQVDLLLVVGSSNSSNSNRLRELGLALGVPSYLIDSPAMIDRSWLEGVKNVGISSGASAPEDIVQQVVTWLKSNFPVENVEECMVMQENVKFSLPKELQVL